MLLVSLKTIAELTAFFSREDNSKIGKKFRKEIMYLDQENPHRPQCYQSQAT
jgi:hypothetical protein